MSENVPTTAEPEYRDTFDKLAAITRERDEAKELAEGAESRAQAYLGQIKYWQGRALNAEKALSILRAEVSAHAQPGNGRTPAFGVQNWTENVEARLKSLEEFAALHAQ